MTPSPPLALIEKNTYVYQIILTRNSREVKRGEEGAGSRGQGAGGRGQGAGGRGQGAGGQGAGGRGQGGEGRGERRTRGNKNDTLSTSFLEVHTLNCASSKNESPKDASQRVQTKYNTKQNK